MYTLGHEEATVVLRTITIAAIDQGCVIGDVANGTGDARGDGAQMAAAVSLAGVDGTGEKGAFELARHKRRADAKTYSQGDCTKTRTLTH